MENDRMVYVLLLVPLLMIWELFPRYEQLEAETSQAQRYFTGDARTRIARSVKLLWTLRSTPDAFIYGCVVAGLASLMIVLVLAAALAHGLGGHAWQIMLALVVALVIDLLLQRAFDADRMVTRTEADRRWLRNCALRSVPLFLAPVVPRLEGSEHLAAQALATVFFGVVIHVLIEVVASFLMWAQMLLAGLDRLTSEPSPIAT